jgi:flagellar basal-body rod protein FlgC
MGWMDSLNISSSGLTAERLRMDVIAENLANANTTRTQEGVPYRRKLIVFAERDDEQQSFGKVLGSAMQTGQGVRAVSIIEDQSPFRRVYEPSHPDADGDGMVEMPNVNPMTEMVDMIAATRAYEANLAALNSTKTMISRAIDLAKG